MIQDVPVVVEQVELNKMTAIQQVLLIALNANGIE